MITRETIPYRVLYTQMTAVVDQNCTFIGTSNDDLVDLFRDYSGMRRFIQIDTRQTSDFRNYWSTINEIDYVKMWKSIPHGAKSPILGLMSSGELKQHQKEMTAKTSAQEWLEELELAPGDKEVDIQVLYNLYKSWCFQIKMKPCRPNYFSRELRNENFESARKSVNGTKVTVFKCNQMFGGS